MPCADHDMLHRAALAGMRGFGRVEPNPMVGCVIGRVSPSGCVEVFGIGHHRAFGGPHAEVDAIAHARSRGVSAERLRGATAWVTLEPCSHVGKQPPCTRALIDAGIARVVAARRDANPISGGGADVLREAGVRFEVSDACPLASRLAEPFLKRITTGLPWVVVKWAQTMDGRIATRTGESQWISGAASRRRVHALRARVDAILVGIGTVKADDPMLTARGVPVRRVAKRVIVDPDLEISPHSRLMRTAREAPVVLAMCEAAAKNAAAGERRARAEGAGAEVIVLPRENGLVSLGSLLSRLARDFGVSTVLAEGGAGLIGRLIASDLVDEAHVYTAGMLLGDEQALPPAKGVAAPRLGDARRFVLTDSRRVGGDLLAVWRRARESA